MIYILGDEDDFERSPPPRANVIDYAWRIEQRNATVGK